MNRIRMKTWAILALALWQSPTLGQENDDGTPESPVVSSAPEEGIEEVVVTGRFISSSQELINERMSDAFATDLLGEETNDLHMRPLQAHCHCSLGTLHHQTGQVEQARAELATALEMYREMEMTFWLPETEAALAEVEGR